jgi:hypothetical protein
MEAEQSGQLPDCNHVQLSRDKLLVNLRAVSAFVEVTTAASCAMTDDDSPDGPNHHHGGGASLARLRACADRRGDERPCALCPCPPTLRAERLSRPDRAPPPWRALGFR